MTETSSRGKRDFFVSFNQADRAWATWIAWVLEEAGRTVWFQDWDFRGNFIEHMDRAYREAERTLAVLSDHYFGSGFTLAEWSARLAQDPAARADRLVPIKVGPIADAGILNTLVYADLTDCDENEAQQQLLGRVKKALDPDYRDKPATRPGVPGGIAREVPNKPQFPIFNTEVRDLLSNFAEEKKNKLDGFTGLQWVLDALRAYGRHLALDHQADIAKVQEWLGHSNIFTTRIYDHRKTRPEDSPTFKVAY